MLRTFRASVWDDCTEKDLVSVVSAFTFARRSALQADLSMTAEFPYTVYRPVTETCEGCGLELLREIGSGL